MQRAPPALRSGSLQHLSRWPTGMDASRCSVSDLADMFATPIDEPARPSTVKILQPGFRHFGGMVSFKGRITTVVCNDCNPLIRKTLNEDGSGRVLVVEGHGSRRCALLGDRLAEHASMQGWAGIVVNGCVRDVSEIRNFLIGIMALDTHPLKPGKRDMGQRDVPVTIGGVTIRPGDWLYADEDGILVSSRELVMPKDAPRVPIPLTILGDDEVAAANGTNGTNGSSGAEPAAAQPAATSMAAAAAEAVAAVDIISRLQQSPFALPLSNSVHNCRCNVSFKGNRGSSEGASSEGI